MRFDQTIFKNHFDVSRETMEKLEQFHTLLIKWNPSINLVSRLTLDDIWHRHFADSAQLWALRPDKPALWLDFGSGAGFPALVNAVLACELAPALEFLLVESDQRKCAFLLTVSSALGLNVRVETSRIEALQSQNADVISARAVPLGRLFEFSSPHAHKSTVLLFPKGNSYESELTAAQKHWHIDTKVVQSLTDSSSVILRIEDFNRAE